MSAQSDIPIGDCDPQHGAGFLTKRGLLRRHDYKMSMSSGTLLRLTIHQSIRNFQAWSFRPVAESIAASQKVSQSSTVSLWRLIFMKLGRIKTILTLSVLDLEDGFILL